MPDLGIKSYAASVPRLRMDRASIAAAHAWALPSLRGLGKGERSFCSWDEDSITMSVDAVRACVRGSASAPIGSLTFASTTAPLLGSAECEPRRGSVRAPGEPVDHGCFGLSAGRNVGADPCPRIERRGRRRRRGRRCASCEAWQRAGDAVRRGERGNVGRPARPDCTLPGQRVEREPVHRPLPRGGAEVRLPVGGALDPRRGLSQDRSRGRRAVARADRGPRRPRSTTSACRRPCPESRRQSRSVSASNRSRSSTISRRVVATRARRTR